MNTSLEIWMDQATRGLALESAMRVRAEIQEHFDSALASGAEPGAAVAALGDPKSANRQYRRVLLTNTDARWLENVRRRGELPPLGAYILLTAGLVTGAAKILRGSLDGSLPPLSLMVIGALFLVPRWVRLDTRLRNRTYRALQWAVIIGGPVALTAAGRLKPAVFFVYLMFVCVAYKDYLLRRKLPEKEWPKDLHI